jgi:hypothetical protein
MRAVRAIEKFAACMAVCVCHVPTNATMGQCRSATGRSQPFSVISSLRADNTNYCLNSADFTGMLFTSSCLSPQPSSFLSATRHVQYSKSRINLCDGIPWPFSSSPGYIPTNQSSHSLQLRGIHGSRHTSDAKIQVMVTILLDIFDIYSE